MGTTQLNVYNRVASLLAQPVMSVVNPDPSNEFSRALNRTWSEVVNGCLERTEFDFAKSRAALSRVLPAPIFGWSYYYQKPADCVRMVRLSQTGLPFDKLGPESWQEEEGKYATNTEVLYIEYVTANAINYPGRWSTSFAEFVACEQAKLIGPKINSGAMETVIKAADRAEKKACSLDAVQGPVRLRRQGSWASANRRHSRGGNPGGWGGGPVAPEQQ